MKTLLLIVLTAGASAVAGSAVTRQIDSVKASQVQAQVAKVSEVKLAQAEGLAMKCQGDRIEEMIQEADASGQRVIKILHQ